MSKPTNRALRPAQLAQKMGISVATVWRYARRNDAFPKPRKLSERVTFFDEAEVDAFLANPTFVESTRPAKRPSNMRAQATA